MPERITHPLRFVPHSGPNRFESSMLCTPERIRTSDLQIRNLTFYPLNYRRQKVILLLWTKSAPPISVTRHYPPICPLPTFVIKNKGWHTLCLRWGWDSDPRCLAAYRFSKPAHSTTMRPHHMRLRRESNPHYRIRNPEVYPLAYGGWLGVFYY